MNNGGGGGAPTAWNSTGWVIASTPPTTNTKLANCLDTGNHGLGGPFSETFQVTAPATPGSYVLYVELDADDGTGAAACGAGTNYQRDPNTSVLVFNVSATLNGGTTATVSPGASVTAAVTLGVTAPINNWESTGWGIGTAEPPFQTQLANCVDTSLVGGEQLQPARSRSQHPLRRAPKRLLRSRRKQRNGRHLCGAGSNNVRLTLVGALVVTSANDAPVATNDEARPTRTPTSPSRRPGVLGNDTDAEDNSLTVGEVNGRPRTSAPRSPSAPARR